MLKNHVILVAIILFFVIASSTSGMYLAVLLRNAIDALQNASSNIKEGLLTFLVQFISLATFSSLCMFFQSILTTMLIERILLFLRQRVVRHAFSHSMDFFSTEPIGKLITLTTRDLDTVGSFFRNVLSQIVSNVISFFVVLAMLFVLSWKLALITLCTVPLLAFFINFYRVRILDRSKLVREKTVQINTYLSEHLQGKLDIQLHGKLNESGDRFSSVADSYYKARYMLGTQEMLLRPFLNLLLIIITVIVIIAGTYFAHAGIVTIGIIIAYIQLINNFFFPLITIAQNITQIQESLVSLNNIFNFLESRPSIVNKAVTAASNASIKSQRGLQFENISFAYKGETKVLKNINFKLSPDTTLALVGHSGAGKSTIVKLCLRFWETQEGRIYLDGTDIRELSLANLRKNIGLLHQDSLIFQGTLRENITMGRDIEQSRLDSIADKSDLYSIMKRSNWNWDSNISSKNLSIGEQRIIAICRVLVDAPKVLLLDEFSATLDNETEKIIQRLLHELQKGRSTLIIAHRLNTIQNANEILYLSNGEILEQGTHSQLLDKKGHYYKMIQKMQDTIVEKTKL